MNKLGFKPDFAVSPGATLAAWKDNKDMALSKMADCLELYIVDAWRLLEGRIKIDDELASKIGELTGISATFWLAREKRYRERLSEQVT